MKYEIINPSDKAFIEGDNEMIVCMATILLGNGYYGLRREDDKFTMPPPVFAQGWFIDHFKKSMDDAFNEVDMKEVKKALSTVKLGGERSSLNDIVKRAKRLSG